MKLIKSLDQNHIVKKNTSADTGGAGSFISWSRLATLLAETGQGMMNSNKEYIRQLVVDDDGVRFYIDAK